MDPTRLENIRNFYSLSAEECARSLESDPHQGLDAANAAARLKVFGPNTLKSEKRRPWLRIFFRQLVNPMMLLLLATVVISSLLGHYTDAVIITAIVALNTGIGYFQEFRAEKAMESLRQMAQPEAQVLRSGRPLAIPSIELVPGDLVLLEAGDRIPGDLRLVEASALQMDESLLTGESVAVYKETGILETPHPVLGDQVNMAFMGTHVVGGRGRGLCVATSRGTELGRIASTMEESKSGQIPLRQKTDQLTRRLVAAAFALCMLIFLLGWLRGTPPLEMLLAAVSLAIAAIPEGLPVVITISLSLGALRLARHGVLVRKLQAVEALGAITTICADKTGTLTQNRMEVKVHYPDGPASPMFLALALSNDARLSDGDSQATGDPMEIALLHFVRDAGTDPKILRQQWKRVRELPFDTDRKRMTTVQERDGKRVALMKGAPETVLPLCIRESRNGASAPPSGARRQELSERQEAMAAEGLRVLAVALKEIDSTGELETDMTFLGFVGLQDPPRPEVGEAIVACRDAGIRPIMITGDHPATAIAIGKQLGIYRDGDEVITGADLQREGRNLLDEKAARASIFARVSPIDKVRIIEVLQDRREIVAMTGDGVNDAPALKKAEIGVAMGRGTDVAKEASALILLEENFSAIVHAVRRGRVIYDNIRKFVRYMLTTNLGEIATMLFAMLAALPLPLLPVQILWINLVTDGLPAVALGFEPAEGNVMGRPPRGRAESILGRGLWQHTIWVGTLMGLLVGGLIYWIWTTRKDLELVRTMTFTALVLMQMGHLLAIRSESRPLWCSGFFSNYRLLIAVLLTVLGQGLILHLPALNQVFHTVPLKWSQWAICGGLALVIYTAVELEKYFRSRQGAPRGPTDRHRTRIGLL